MGNQKEFIEMIKTNEGLIYKVAKVYSSTKEDEQDLYQEIVYQLWKSFDSFKNESKISTWMYQVALNTCISHSNKEKKKGKFTLISEGMTNKSEPIDRTKEEQIEVLYALILNLDTIEKAIILLYLEGKTYDEIANITGFTVTNVGTRLGRIKQKIKTQIKN